MLRAVVVEDGVSEDSHLMRLLDGYAETIASSVSEAVAEMERGRVDLIIVVCAAGREGAADLIAAFKKHPYILIRERPGGDHLVSASCGNHPGVPDPLGSVVSELVERIRIGYGTGSDPGRFPRAYEAVLAVNEENRVEEVSPAAERMFQYRAGELIGMGVEILLPLCLPKPGGGGDAYETMATRKDGSRFPVELSIDGADRERSGRAMITLRDLTSRPDPVALLEEHAVRDDQTGLLTEESLGALLGEAVKRSDRYGFTVALLMAELDHLGIIGEMHGPKTGDDALAGAARIVAREVREADRVVRYRGEKIVVILQEVTELQALATAERIRRCVSHLPFTAASEESPVPIRLSVTVGAAFYPADADSPQALLKAAGKALEEGKRHGCDHVVSFNLDSSN